MSLRAAQQIYDLREPDDEEAEEAAQARRESLAEACAEAAEFDDCFVEYLPW